MLRDVIITSLKLSPHGVREPVLRKKGEEGARGELELPYQIYVHAVNVKADDYPEKYTRRHCLRPRPLHLHR